MGMLATTTVVEPLHQAIRVLAVIPAGSSASSMIFARRQVASLRRAGVVCETFLLASRTSPWTLIKEWRRLRRVIRSFRPEVLHAHYGTVTALLSGCSSRLPLVVTYRGSDLNPDLSVKWVVRSTQKLISQLVALRATEIICVSEQLKDRLWWRAADTKIIPTGVDIEAFYPRERADARRELGWDERDRVVLFNAGGHPLVKRPDIALAAVDQASKICGDVRLITLNGDVAPENVPIMMSAADCLLLTSQWEGSPTVVQEAMACNLPIVSVDVGDVRLRVEGVLPSRIVERNPATIGKALAEILSRRDRSNGRTRAEEISSVAIAARVACVYRAIIQPRKRAEIVKQQFPTRFVNVSECETEQSAIHKR